MKGGRERYEWCVCVYVCVGERKGGREKRKGEGGRERCERCVYTCVCMYVCGGRGGREGEV